MGQDTSMEVQVSPEHQLNVTRAAGELHYLVPQLREEYHWHRWQGWGQHHIQEANEAFLLGLIQKPHAMV